MSALGLPTVCSYFRMEIPAKKMKIEAATECFSILEVPEEILVNIFKFLNVPSRKNSALVCHQFHAALCELEKDRIAVTLSIDDVGECFYFAESNN